MCKDVDVCAHNALNCMQFWHHTLKFHPYCVAVFLSMLIVSYQSKSETELSKKQIQTRQGPARSHAGVISWAFISPLLWAYSCHYGI